MIDPNDPTNQAPAQRKKRPMTDASGLALPPPPVAPSPPQQHIQQPGPTNFVNFQRRFTANRDVANREAAKYGQQATTAAQKAATDLGTAQQKFQQGVNTGTVGAPGGGPSTNTGGAAPVGPPAFGAQPVAPRPQMVGRQTSPPPAGPTGSESTAPGTASQALTGESTKGDGPTIEQMLAQAGLSYSGPEGIDTVEASKSAEAANQQLAGLKDANGVQALVNESGPSGTNGADALSGALIGQAGRQDFDALRARFNPNKDITDAQKAASDRVKKAKEDSVTNAGAWGREAESAQNAKDVADQQQSDAIAAQKAGSAGRLANIPTSGDPNDLTGGLTDPADIAARNKEIAAWTDAQKGTTNDWINNAFEDFNAAASPVNWVTNAAGVRDPVQDYETKSAHGGSGASSGGTNGRNIDWAAAGPAGFWVFRQMTPEDWQTLNSKPRNGANGQKTWILRKYEQLMKDQKAKAGPAAPPVGTSRSG